MAQWLSICLPPMWPGSIPGLGAICGLSLLLVLVPAPRGFSPGSPVFPSPQKPTFLNSNSIWNPRGQTATCHPRKSKLIRIGLELSYDHSEIKYE